MPYKALHDAALVKFDEEGNKLWSKIHGGTNYEYFNFVKTVSDGFIAVGYSNSKNIDGLSNLGSFDCIVVKYDKEGNVLDLKVTALEDWIYSFELYTDLSVEVIYK